MSTTKRKIGKVLGKGDKFGYYPDLFSACVNRTLRRNRRHGKYVVPDENMLSYASQVCVRFCRRYCSE